MATSFAPYSYLFMATLLSACSGADFGSSAAGKAPSRPSAAATSSTTDATSAGTNSTDGSAAGAAPGVTVKPASNSTDGSSGAPKPGDVLTAIGQIAKLIPSSGAPSPVLPTGKKSCSNDYAVPGTANPYFAGSPDSASLTYDLSQGGGPNPVDTGHQDAAVLIAPVDTSCIAVGAKLSFAVHGSISVGNGNQATDANGNLSLIVDHQLGATNGKSDVTAPINSLLAVFLGPDDPAGAAVPTALDFTTPASRDYVSLTPALGQVFFVGTGKTSSGAYHVVTVPQGATRLYFAIMDHYQWNNNTGSLNGSIFIN